MIKNIVIFLILLGSAFFFNVVFLPGRVIFLIQFAITGLMLLTVIVQQIYGGIETDRHNFRQPLFLILTGVFLSMIIAQSFHSQSFALTFWAQRYMYFYVFYFFLHILKPDIKDLEKIILTLGFLYAASYIVQFLIFPTTIFDVRQGAERGTIRIFIPGSSFLRLALFYYLHRFYTQNRIRDVYPVVIFLSILILQGTRYGLSATVLVILGSLIFSKTIRSRYLIFVIVLISIAPLYFIFQDIFAGLIEVSERQSQNIESDIRIRAATFFLTDFFPNTLAYIFGNGQDHMGSIYGIRVNAYKIYHGFYQSDIGIIGDFSKYGLFFVVGTFWLIIKTLRTPLKSEYTYLKYYIFNAALVMPVSSVFANSFSIALWCVMLYIIDYNINTLTQESADAESGLHDMPEHNDVPGELEKAVI